MFLFGLVTICQGLVQNYSGLLATRFFLGVAESGMFPGSFYLIGMWYKRSEAQRRFSFFFGSTSLAGALGVYLVEELMHQVSLTYCIRISRSFRRPIGRFLERSRS